MPASPTLLSTDAIIGQDFLTWLWYRSDTENGFTDGTGTSFSVIMDRRVVVEGGDGESKETASASGSPSPLREARFGLGTGKKVSQAVLRLEREEDEYQMTLKAEDFCLGSLRTPKIDRESQDEDPDGLVLEKYYLMETAVGLLDAMFAEFLKLRLSGDWNREAEAVGRWMVQP
ncbi:MAG: hypothetical protein LBR22_07460 [Desulfovibrio sp.]|jgi:hypothetical protein|nr:hypothetical protein [Desulfovibrio sp.]